jgi:hypothetical protein
MEKASHCADQVCSGPAGLVIACAGAIPPDLLDALRRRHNLTMVGSAAAASGELACCSTANLVLVGVDAYSPAPALAMLAELRAATGATVVLVASGRGLRRTTRAQAQRLGAADFLTDEIPVSRFLARVEEARVLALRPRSCARPAYSPPIQPTWADGRPRLMTGDELRAVIWSRMPHNAIAPFAVALLHIPDMEPDAAFELLRKRVRLADGDLVALLEDRRFAVLFNDVEEQQSGEIVSRIITLHPAFGALHEIELFHAPTDQYRLLDWLSAGAEGGTGPVPPREPTHGR